jgi:hypothetical protein
MRNAENGMRNSEFPNCGFWILEFGFKIRKNTLTLGIFIRRISGGLGNLDILGIFLIYA